MMACPDGGRVRAKVAELTPRPRYDTDSI